MNPKSAALDLANELEEAAEELDGHATRVNVTRCVSSSASLAGSVAVLFGGLSIFLSGGATLPVVAAACNFGATMATVGGLTSTGASVVGALIRKKRMDSLKKKYENFKKSFDEYTDGYAFNEAAKDIISNYQTFEKTATAAAASQATATAAKAAETAAAAKAANASLEATNALITVGEAVKASKAPKGIAFAGKLVSEAKTASNAQMEIMKALGKATKASNDSAKAAKAATEAAKAATTTAKASCKTADAASIMFKGTTKSLVFLNVINAGSSIYDIVDSSKALSKKTGCPAGEGLRQYAAELRDMAKKMP